MLAARFKEDQKLTDMVTPRFAVIDGTRTHVDDAAQIWAEATAKRDNDPDVAPLSLSRPILENALKSSDEAFLLIAVDQDGKAIGMALVSPGDATPRCAALHFLAVSPTAWGLGVGTSLLEKLTLELSKRGFRSAELEVYEDNHSAIGLYRQQGWRLSKPASIHQETGKRLLCFAFDAPEIPR